MNTTETTMPADLVPASKHTPGPWKRLPPDQVRGQNGEWICSCEGGRHRLKEDIANARLIAAAPELLEALIEAVDSGASWNGISRARASIAKAKGLP